VGAWNKERQSNHVGRGRPGELKVPLWKGMTVERDRLVRNHRSLRKLRIVKLHLRAANRDLTRVCRSRAREREQRHRDNQHVRADNDGDDADSALPTARQLGEVMVIAAVAPNLALQLTQRSSLLPSAAHRPLRLCAGAAPALTSQGSPSSKSWLRHTARSEPMNETSHHKPTGVSPQEPRVL
jgi:hypothetical protein